MTTPFVPDPFDVAKVATLIPPTAEVDNGWSEVKIITVMTEHELGVAETVRFYWLERVNETVEYMKIGDKELIQLHNNAKAMLAYWDAVIAANKDGITTTDQSPKKPITFGTIDRGPRVRR